VLGKPGGPSAKLPSATVGTRPEVGAGVGAVSAEIWVHQGEGGASLARFVVGLWGCDKEKELWYNKRV
jgi:hypothetical protein